MITTHELLEIRWDYKQSKQYERADTLKRHLENDHNLIITDNKDCFETVFLSNNTNKKDYLLEKKKNRRHEKVFESWLFSMNSKIKTQYKY